MPPQAEVLSEVVARCTGFPGDSDVTFTLDGTVLGTTTTAADGSCAFTFTMPAQCGSYTLVATDGTVTTSSTIDAPCPAGEVQPAGALPYTGSNSAPIAQIGLGLLFVGAMITIVVRTRRTATNT